MHPFLFLSRYPPQNPAAGRKLPERVRAELSHERYFCYILSWKMLSMRQGDIALNVCVSDKYLHSSENTQRQEILRLNYSFALVAVQVYWEQCPQCSFPHPPPPFVIYRPHLFSDQLQYNIVFRF